MSQKYCKFATNFSDYIYKFAKNMDGNYGGKY